MAVEVKNDGRILQGKVYLVTGGRRGIGSEIVKSLASQGATIVANYTDTSPKKIKRNEALAQEVAELGGVVHFVQADITRAEDRKRLFDSTLELINNESATGVLSGAFWNAAGGLEEGKADGWPELINTQSNLALAEEFSHVMDPNSLQVYVTSLWSHRYGQVKQLPFYRPVARTKYLAEKKLRKAASEGEIAGRLGILCGHVITDTGAYSLLKKNFSDRLAVLEQLAEGGKFPTAADMGAAALKMALEGYAPGETIYVGGREAENLELCALEPLSLSRSEILKRYPMYSPGRLYLDQFESPADELDSKGKEQATAWYTVRKRDTLGHFTGKWGDIKLWRGVDRIEAAAQALGLNFLTLEPNSSFVPLFLGGQEYDFNGIVTSGEKVQMETVLTAMTPRGLRGNVEMKVGNETVTTIRGLRLALAPDVDTARTLIRKQIAKRQLNADSENAA